MECYSTIVGTSFRDSDAKRAVNAMQPGEEDFRLEREPDNAYDPLAIKVLYGEDELFIGYLAKANNATIACALDDGEEPRVRVVDFDGRKPVVSVSW